MTGRTEQAYPMMPECLRVGLFETRQLFINLQRTLIVRSVCVTSRKVVWLFPEQLWFDFVPFFHRLQGRLTAQG